MIGAAKLATLEAHRRRIWGLCYRMTGDSQASEDLAQDALARAMERGEQASEATFEGWLYRVATTTCLDWLRRKKVERAAVSLVDPVDLADAPFASDDHGESRLLRREDVRLAVLTSLRTLVPRQRAVLVLRDVFDRSTEETATALGLSEVNVRALLHRARARLEAAHRVADSDAPVEAEVVERFACALEAGDLEQLTALLSEDVWGLVDDGLGRRKPTLGLRAVSRQWRNALSRYGRANRIARVRLNGEPALVIVIGGMAFASVHLESRAGKIASIRVVLDPARLARLGIAGATSC